MTAFRVLLVLISVFGASWLAIFLGRELGRTLRTGMVGTMRGRTYRRSKPGQYWVFVSLNVLFIGLCAVFIVLVLLATAAALT
jgi:hypothetical protein